MTLIEQLVVLGLLWAVWLWIVFRPRKRQSISRGVDLLNKRIRSIRERDGVK